MLRALVAGHAQTLLAELRDADPESGGLFADDVLQCPCGGRRSVIAVVTDPALTNTLLTALELPCEPVTFAPARSPPQAELAWDEAS